MFNEKFSKKNQKSKGKIVQKFAEGGPVRKTLEVHPYDRNLGKSVLKYSMDLDKKLGDEGPASFKALAAGETRDVADEVRGRKKRGGPRLPKDEE